MGNSNNSFISNLFIFIAGVCGAYNIRIAVRTLKHGTRIEQLIKANEELKNENEKLKTRLEKYEQRGTQ